MASDSNISERLNKALDAWHASDADAAISELEALVKLAPSDVRLVSMLGAYLWDAGRADDAVPYLRRAAAEQPASERASRFLFHALWDSGQHAEAAQCLRKLLAVRRVDDLEIVLRDVERNIADEAS